MNIISRIYAMMALLLLSGMALVDGNQRNFTEGWKFRQRRAKIWCPSTVPGTVHTDQSQNGGIFDKLVSIFARKVRYHYGWGSRLVTSGIWHPIVLLTWNGERI